MKVSIICSFLIINYKSTKWLRFNNYYKLQLFSYSLENTGVHSEFENLIVICLHNLFNCCLVVTFHCHVAILKQELVQNVAVIRIHWQDFVQACENFLCSVPAWINERCKLFSKVNGLINSHLSRIFLILFK